MMGPDYTHWHGTYEVAKRFYTELIPELEELAEKYMADEDPQKAEQAQKLMHKIEEVLNSTDHKWYLDKMDPEEKTRRQQAAEEFKKQYQP